MYGSLLTNIYSYFACYQIGSAVILNCFTKIYTAIAPAIDLFSGNTNHFCNVRSLRSFITLVETFTCYSIPFYIITTLTNCSNSSVNIFFIIQAIIMYFFQLCNKLIATNFTPKIEQHFQTTYCLTVLFNYYKGQCVFKTLTR